MDEEKLKRLVQEGKNQREIADLCEVSQSTIGRWLRACGMKTDQPHRCNCGESNPDRFTGGRHSECKKCRSKRQSELYKRYKQDAVEYKGGKCVRCGYKRCLASLDFHHTDPETKDSDWKKMRHRSFASTKSELDKCVLVCRNCHGEIHDKLYGIDIGV